MKSIQLTEEQVQQITNEAYLEGHEEYIAMSEAQKEAFDDQYAEAVIRRVGMDNEAAVEFAIECAQEYNDWREMYEEGMTYPLVLSKKEQKAFDNGDYNDIPYEKWGFDQGQLLWYVTNDDFRDKNRSLALLEGTEGDDAIYLDFDNIPDSIFSQVFQDFGKIALMVDLSQSLAIKDECGSRLKI